LQCSKEKWSVSSSHRKARNKIDVLREAGSAFHTHVATTENAQSSAVHCGTGTKTVSVDREHRQNTDSIVDQVTTVKQSLR